jgi:hypothetical protein
MWKIEYTINEARKKKMLRLLIENSAKPAFMAIVQYSWGQKCLIFAT